MIPFSRQFVDNSDIKSVIKSLKSNFLTQGPLVNKFEKKVFFRFLKINIIEFIFKHSTIFMMFIF